MSKRVSDAETALDAAKARLAEVREKLDVSRTAERVAESDVSTLDGESAALQNMIDAGKGGDEVVAALREAFPDLVRGTLSESIEVPEGSARAFDRALGTLARGVSFRTVRGSIGCVRGMPPPRAPDGPLVILRLDLAPEASGPLPDGVSATGPGAG